MSGLRGFDVHPIWRYEAFRQANFRHRLAPADLDRPAHNLGRRVYERMEPALRLATIFLIMASPDLARIMYGSLETQINAAGQPEQRLKAWRSTPAKLKTFQRELVQISKQYRFTWLPYQAANPQLDCPYEKEDTAITDLMMCPLNRRPLKEYYPQSALGDHWRLFLERQDWDTMQQIEKDSQLLLLAVTLIHELAHAVWWHRLSPLYAYNQRYYSQLDFDPTEPKMGMRPWAECGYVIEEMMLGGFLSFANVVHSTTVPPYRIPPVDRLLFTSINHQTGAWKINAVRQYDVSDFFDPDTWDWDAQDEEYPNFAVLRARLNTRPPLQVQLGPF
ncbi:hypothetical protein LTS15_003551 [Exophiala xenobiotica]|nr:hypothetical protein LTS15_003551 [Exophiala xenobiotica]